MRVACRAQVPAGPERLTFRFEPDPGKAWLTRGTMVIRQGDQDVGQGRIQNMSSLDAEAAETFDIGDDSGTLVSPEYQGAARFNGIVRNVTLDLARP